MISEWIGCDRVGSIIEGRFPLQRWLGGAGESGVFLTQVGGASPRNAAIKIVPAGIADAESLLDQWMKAKRRVHPHLIQLFHAGYCRMDDCDLLYAVTDRADEILADVLPVRALTPAEVREMLDSLLETLTWLHGQGLVHGSLKPSNIMVVNERIRISVDRIQPAGPRMFPVLSPGIYEAPESALKIAPAADLWSLGVLLVEALTQKPPLWYGTGPRIPASVPQPFAEIASECLRLDPARRCTLREIRSHLAPAPRTVAVPAAPKAPAAEGARTSASPAVVAPPAPVFKAPDSAEHSRALLAQLALAHVAQAQPPADLAPHASAGSLADPSPDLPPPVAETAPPEIPSAGTAALEPALPVVSPAIPQTPQPDLQPQPATIAPAAETAKPDYAPPAAEALLVNPPAEAPTEIAPKNPEAAPEPPGIAPEPQAVAPEPSATAPEPPAIAPEPLAPAPSALKTPEKPLAAAPAPDAHAQLPAAAAQRRVNNPSAEPVQSAERPRANRLATLVASAMVVIAAGLMLLLALHVSSSSAAAPASATNQSPVPAPPSAPLPQAVVPPASAPAPILPAPAAPTLPSPAANAPSPVKPNSPTPVPAPSTAAPGMPNGASTSGAVLQRVLPHVTQRALDTLSGRMVVIVRVQVDASGNVTDATYDYEGTSHYLKTAALKAANNWKFQPPRIGGRPVSSTWDLQFWFDQSGPSVIAIEKNS